MRELLKFMPFLYRPIFGFSACLITEVVNPLSFQSGISHEGIFLPKKDDIYIDQLIKSYRLPSKKNKFICLNSKVDFFTVGHVSNVVS